MEKDKLLKTIGRYFMNGQCDKAVLKIKNKTLESHFFDNTEQCVGKIRVSDFDLQDSVLGLGSTQSFLNILKPFGEKIQFKIEGDDENSSKILMSDGTFNSRYYLFDKSVIPQIEIDETGLGDVALEFKLNTEFIANFKKAKDAISDSKHFAIVSDDKSTRCVINYNQTTNNHILFKFTPDIKNSDDIKLVFDTSVFSEVINANIDFTEATLQIFKNCKDFDNILLITFKGLDWESSYYIIPKVLQTKDEE
jgi:hypothetical protein